MADTIYQKVEEVLKESPHARNKDTYLLFDYLNKYHTVNLTVMDWLKMVEQGDIPNYTALSRMRRRVQEDQPDLRGDTYDGRQRRAQEMGVAYASR